MDSKAFILCFAFFVVIVLGSSLCRCANEEPKDTVSKYNLKVVMEGNTELDETVEIDTVKETEKIHIPSNGDTSESAPGEVDVIFDFKLNLAMHRLSNQRACFLSNSTAMDNLPKPAVLKRLLDMGLSEIKPASKRYEYVVEGNVNDRSFLSDEMADLCAKLPIYRLKAVPTDAEKDKYQLTRTKHNPVCWYEYYDYTVCLVFRCWTVTIRKLRCV